MTNTATTQASHGPAATAPVGPWRVLLRAVIAFAITLAVYGPALLVMRLPWADAGGDAQAGNWGLVLLKQGAPVLLIPLTAVVLLMACTRWLDKRPFSITGIRFDRRWVPALLLGTAISVAIIVPVTVSMTKLGLAGPEITPSPEPLWLGLIFALLLGYGMQGITEEFVWRGWLTQSVGGSYQRRALISAVAFGLIHVLSNGGQPASYEGLIYVVNAGAFGYAAAALYFATGSLWAAVGIHGGLHLGNFIAVSFGSVEHWTTNLVTLTLYLVVGLVVMRRLPGRDRA